MKILYVLFFLIIISIAMIRCQHPDKVENQAGYANTNSSSDTIPTENIVNRLKAIEKCASCHKEEYDNWLIGPHANSYKSLLEHKHYVDTSKNFSDAYRDLLSSSFSTLCISCHTGQNVYETVFKGLDSENNENQFTDKIYPNIYKHPPLIRNEKLSGLSTGVDCLTCHKSGDKVVTDSSYAKNNKKENNKSCELIASKFFSTNMNCYTCHPQEIESMKTYVASGHLKNEINCNSCHMEQDDKGKPTHYYYWKKDAPGKHRPEKLNMFSDIYAEIRTKNGKQEVFFHWGNNYIPHGISGCGETAVYVEVWDKNNKLQLEFHELVNQKGLMMQCNTSVKLFEEGELGTSLNMIDKPIEKEIPIVMNLIGGKIIIRGMNKPQYWSDKKELIEVFRKEIRIH